MLVTAIVLLPADLPAGKALARIDGYSDRALVVLRLELTADVWWVVLEVAELRERLAGASPETPLEDALDFTELEPAETRQALGPEDVEGFTGVVLDGDRLVGVAHADTTRAPREEAPKEERERAGRKAVPREPTFRRDLLLPYRPGATDEEGVEYGDVGAPPPDDYQDDDLPPPRPPLRSPAEEARYVVVPVFYGTDREIREDGGVEPSEIYTAGRGDLTYGVAEVSIPRTHETGEMERPRWWKLEFREDPSRHVVLVGVERLGEGDFVGRVSEGLETADRREALVFVHGFNVTFAQAARRAAQLAYDLRYPGLPLLYSWPSQGQTLDYLTDHTNARWTVEHFQRFLTLALSRVGAERVHVLAHSMGNLPLVETLARFDTGVLPEGSASLSQVVFAAPDFDADTFRDLARVFPGKAGRFTLYASSNDRALKLSRKLRSDLVRAGESGPHLVITDGVDTVDASEAESEIFLGHSYYGKRTILSDIFYLLQTGSPPDERFGLRPRRLGEAPYWEFVP